MNRLTTLLRLANHFPIRNFLRSSIVYSMAASTISSRLSPVNLTKKEDENGQNQITKTTEDELGDYEILSGAQLSAKHSFKSARGKTLSVTPIIVDFRRLIQSKASAEIVPGVTNRELLHAVVALYDVSLSEMMPDVLYSATTEKWGRTVILLKDIKDTLADLEERRAGAKSKAEEEKETDDTEDAEEETKEKEGDEDVYEGEEEKPCTFAEIFSDSDDDDEEESDEEEEEDFSKGIAAFIKLVKKRREIRLNHEGPFTAEHVGIENRLVAAATFEKTYCKPNDRVLHLTVISVRQRFRKWGIGKYLLSQIKDMTVVGMYDAIVVHADNSAVDFFERYGFTDDIVLNSRWSELAEQYTNCTLMCYLPPFTGQTITKETTPELDIMAMDKDIRKWREKSMEAYRSEVSLIDRLRHEVIHLRALVSSQQDLITTFAAENQKLTREKFLIEKEFLEYRFSAARAAFNGAQSDDDEDSISADQLIRQLEDEASEKINSRASAKKDGGKPRRDSADSHRYAVSRGEGRNGEPYDHGKDAEEFYKVTREFYETMKQDESIFITYEVKMVSKAMIPNGVEESYNARIKKLADPRMVARMYFCGSLTKSQRIEHILDHGFTEEDFTHAEFGKGLYFSKFPSKAAQFSSLGKLIVAEVGLGQTETVLEKKPSRTSPSQSNDSIITPGRLNSSGDTDSMLCQEYVVFDVNQARPFYLIEYSPVCSSNCDKPLVIRPDHTGSTAVIF